MFEAAPRKEAVAARSSVLAAEKKEDLRSKLPSVTARGFWNLGTCGPLPLAVTDAMLEAIHAESHQGRSSIQAYLPLFAQMDSLQEQLASIFSCTRDEIALTQSTTEGMNIALWGIGWQAGDEIVTTTSEHPSLLAPLAAVSRRFGVEIRYLPLCGEAEVDAELLRKAITPKSRLLAFSHVSYATGLAFSIERLGKIAREAGMWVLVDGAQSAGVLPIHLSSLPVDLFAAPAQKWLLGPEGMGFLYVRNDCLSRLHPTFTGIMGVRQGTWFDPEAPFFVPAVGASRYHAGGRFRPLVAGFSAALRFLQEDVGWPWLVQETHATALRLREALQTLPSLRLLTPPSAPGHLLTFSLEGLQADKASVDLEAKGIILRSIPSLPSALRLSVSFFHTDGDLDRLLDALSSLVSQLS